ncbi:MAG: DNA recombination protein RmuC [Kiritimatiellae bacterium]|nr:DNA recombination protein RmuC [Kiritimatiellia bacterium]
MNSLLLIALLLLGLLSLGLQLARLFREKDSLPEPVRRALATAEETARRIEQTLRDEIGQSREESAKTARAAREELAQSLKGVADSMSQQLATLSRNSGEASERMRETLEQRLRNIQKDNAEQLEKMRQTVDEKLQTTLEKRLGESFRQVSERLELVHQGLGEMQALATGVGDLKKVLTNVKTRGTWGEVQLGTMLEQALAPGQYAENVSTKGGGERVEFAIRLPGKRDSNSEEPVWLPIDAKFPMEDYQRLVEAQEAGDAPAAEAAAKQLETRVRNCAKDIERKYIAPPATTDFAILYLPTEGLFAEVIRRPGLSDGLQRDCRVVIAGPTTLWALLNSLQMGFRTLAIQKRSSEVWELLATVKEEWTKYGAILDKVHKKLGEASNTIEEAQRKTRTIGRKLRSVESMPAAADSADLLLALPDTDDEPEET